MPAILRPPSDYWNRGSEPSALTLARRGVVLVGSVKSGALVEVVASAARWHETAASLRRGVRHALATHVAPLSDVSAAIATAILIGDRAGLSPDIERRLQEAGTYHVIAISGGNIAVLTALLFSLLRRIGVRGSGVWPSALLLLVTYAAVVVGSPSVWRATLMAVVYLVVRWLDHRTAAANAVSVSAALIVLVEPLAVIDVGFWLTFGATAALALAAWRWRHWGRPVIAPRSLVAWAVHGVLLLIVATLSVELALAPIGAYVFGRVTIAGLLLNLVAIPAMTIVQLGAIAVVMSDAAGIGAASTSSAWMVHVAVQALTRSSVLLDVAPWLTWRVVPPDAVTLAAYYGTALAAIGAAVSRRRRVAYCAVAVATVLMLWIVTSPPARVRAHGDERLHLTMFDVGQGDATLITFPNGRTLMVDTGNGPPHSGFDMGDRVIGPALRAQGLLALDYLAVTHGDPDHVGGAPALVRDFAPGEVWWGVAVANHEPAAALQREAERARASWRTLQRGDRLEIGGATLRVLHPPPPDWERQRVRNNDSLVLEVRLGDVSLLVTGDIGREVEADLISQALAPLVVLKVPHHGSATSSSWRWLSAVRPRVAIIGVGRRNLYGHPVPAVLERLRAVGAEVLRTDVHGQIDIVTDGRQIEVSTFTGERYVATAAW